MQIGAMTNPYRELMPQIHWIGKHGFDYVDLAVEPPLGKPADLDVRALHEAADAYGLGIVVHTSPYLPLASRHAAVREAAWSELLTAVELAGELHSPLLTLHYLGAPVFYSVQRIIGTYSELLKQVVRAAEKTGGMAVALENSPSNRGEVALFREIFRNVPESRLLLDCGHTHLNADKDLAEDFLTDPISSSRLAHVHLSDNNGIDDLHLPLGSVRNGVDWKKTVGMLRRNGYDERITLEIFSPDRDYLLASREKLLNWWDAAEKP